MDKIDIDKIKEDLSYVNKEAERREQLAREKYFEQHGRWPEEDGIVIEVVI